MHDHPPRWRAWVLYGVGIYASLVVFGVGLLWLMARQAPLPAAEQALTKWLGGDLSPSAQPFSGQVVPPTSPKWGPDDAKITIVEFADFQCPYCQASSYVIRQVVNEFGSDVRFVFRHFPIEYVHPLAPALALASMCANEQGKFWPIHDRFFQHQESIADRNDIDLQAQAVGLNMRDYNNCMLAKRWEEAINKDLSDAIQLGGRGTPTWLVNGKKIEGHLTIDAWRQIIQSLR
jgi:protein-disulfide isomerase